MTRDEHIKKAVGVVKQGGIIIFPTDTAFGIGCRLDRPDTVQKLFLLRNRPETKATPVLVDTVLMAQSYLEPIPQDVIDRLVEPYWPGALTVVLPCLTDKVPSLARGGGLTMGVRIPNHATTREIIREIGVPLLGPSANFAGEKTPYQLADVNPKLIALVDYVVPGECSVKQASTVIDASQSPWKILRKGAVTVL